ncbi:MAG TPA: EF-hand domain-containing protein [Polyangia bacterium]
MTMPRLFALCGPAALLGSLAAVPVALANKEGAEAHGPDAMFKMMDANGDGKISAQEHADAAKKMFTKMDTNGDGKVTAAEMDAFHEHLMARKMHGDASKEPHKSEHGEMSSADKIKAIDTDHDGVLTADEHAAGSKSMFEKMDTDHDGFLSKAELEAGHAKLMNSKPTMGTGSK